MEAALVVRLPKNWWTWDMPAMPGWTIGSSGRMWLAPQSTRNVVTPPPPLLPASCGPPGPFEALPALGPPAARGGLALPPGGAQAPITSSADATTPVTANNDRRIKAPSSALPRLHLPARRCTCTPPRSCWRPDRCSTTAMS